MASKLPRSASRGKCGKKRRRFEFADDMRGPCLTQQVRASPGPDKRYTQRTAGAEVPYAIANIDGVRQRTIGAGRGEANDFRAASIVGRRRHRKTGDVDARSG